MRTALFALTEGGAQLVRRLAEAVEGGGTIYLPERMRGTFPQRMTSYILRVLQM